jgi:hypothetical protein
MPFQKKSKGFLKKSDFTTDGKNIPDSLFFARLNRLK